MFYMQCIHLYIQKLFHVPVPTLWCHQDKLITVLSVKSNSEEFQGVLSRLRRTIPSVQLINLERIQNLWLWDRYSHSRELMLLKSPEAATERELFHGTRATPPNQVYQSECGFDFRLASPTARWGAGMYFASSAMYSHAFAYSIPNTSHRQMILAKVLTGASCTLPPDNRLRRPPPKPADRRSTGRVQFSTDLYDSVHGQSSNSDIYVVYEHDKAYPAYVITYSV